MPGLGYKDRERRKDRSAGASFTGPLFFSERGGGGADYTYTRLLISLSSATPRVLDEVKLPSYMFNLPEIKGKLISISSVEKRQKYLCIRFLPSKDRNGRGDVLSPLAAPLYLIENQETLRRDYVTESFSPPPLII